MVKISLRFIPFFLVLIGILSLPLFLSCGQPKSESPGGVANGSATDSEVSIDEVSRDLAAIQKEGVLRAITVYSPTTYYIYRGQPQGYEYEMLEWLAEDLDLDLEIVIAKDLDEVTQMLREGKGDVIAHGLAITKSRKKEMAFSEYHILMSQVLVQAKPANWRKMKLHEIERALVRNPVELIGKTVSVRENSSYFLRISNLSEEIGDDILVDTVPGSWTTEDIIQKVSKGEITYTIADQHIAMLNETYYDNIDVKTPVSFQQRLGWGLRHSSPELKKQIDKWILAKRSGTKHNMIFNRYFKNKKSFKDRMTSEYYSVDGGTISPYDDLIKKAATRINWDWRILAAQVFQESRFDPKAKSWAGARGLLQVMPRTGQEYGYTPKDLFDPKKGIRAGADHLEFLIEYWEEIPDSIERVRFILASYNVGQGHVRDAQRLAQKFGKNPEIWKNSVENYILLKSNPKYFNDPVVQYGYARGQEPYDYVRDIFKRYDLYQGIFPLVTKDETMAEAG